MYKAQNDNLCVLLVLSLYSAENAAVCGLIDSVGGNRQGLQDFSKVFLFLSGKRHEVSSSFFLSN